MSDWPITSIKDAIEEAIGWLDRALDIATEDPEVCDHWKPLGELVDRIGQVLAQARTLMPLDPELQEAVDQEWRAMSEHDSADLT